MNLNDVDLTTLGAGGGGSVVLGLLIYWIKNTMNDLKQLPQLLNKVDNLIDKIEVLVEKTIRSEEKIANLEKRLDKLEEKL